MLSLALAAFLATAGHGCPQFFVGGQAPQVAAQICFDGYALGHVAANRGPAWSAEHLTAAGVAQALAARRAGAFHPEALLPKSDRAELRDYRCAPFDRGHMTPVGDFGIASQENDTFTLANMVPQDPALNEGTWAGLEGAVRALATADGELFVVTGPVYGAAPSRLQSRVSIPSATFKAVYDPKTGQAAAYEAANDASGHYRVTSVAELAAQIGFDPFPALPAAVKAVAGVLPPALKGNSVLPARSCH